MNYLYNEIYWCKSYLTENSYEMMITYVNIFGMKKQSNINIKKLKLLLKKNSEFRQFIIAICNDFYKYKQYNYDFIFLRKKNKIIMTIIKVDYNDVRKLFYAGNHNKKHNYLLNYEKYTHKIIE